ncbi:hypothetical protein [Sinomonas sp. P10A9]|uniref:DUF91 domain-containing protein n=1 Tax=Sinomonas puerhi TaxID=3238584 RepID=A0AB39KZL3_9MICC
MTAMGRLEFGRLTEAWKGEASDFTPLLADRLDEIGSAIGVDLIGIGKTEVPTSGGRRIDIVAEGADGTSFVIENQYGRADHDHLTRGLAYAVAPPRARGLVVIAEEHRDEFRAIAEYLNDLAELDQDKGIRVWLVEARAVRIGDSLWAPLFDAVVRPNAFIASVGAAKRSEGLAAADDFWSRFTNSPLRQTVEQIIRTWQSFGHGIWYYRDGHATLTARAPVTGGFGQRAVIALYPDGRVGIPFSSYAGSNSGFAIPALTTESFRSRANALFGLEGRGQRGKTSPGWISDTRIDELITYSIEVAEAYRVEVERMTIDADEQFLVPDGEA